MTKKIIECGVETKTRLDQILVEHFDEDISRARLQKLIKNGHVLIDRNPVRQASLKLSGDLTIEIDIPAPVEATPQAQDIPLDIIFEDDDLIVLNKPVGLVVHPGAGNHDGTLVNALLHHCKGELSGIGGVERPGIVHRLDKETSGVMIAAKTDTAHRGLSKQLETRSLSREYIALLWGEPIPGKGTIDASIGRHRTNRQKMAVTSIQSKDAVTHYEVVERYLDRSISLVTCKLQTGRTHQIRVHMAHQHHWLIGDPLYGKQNTSQRAILKKTDLEKDVIEEVIAFPRQALHAKKLSFIHPVSGENLSFEAEIAADIEVLIKKISI